MYLLNVRTYRLEVCRDGTPYAVLSTDGSMGRVFYQHVTSEMTEDREEGYPGYAKVLAACKQARLDGYRYIWIDTCCIDKEQQRLS